MKRSNLFIIVLLATLYSSCYSYKVTPTQYSKLDINHYKRIAYVEKDTLQQEFNILTASQLFDITSDSTKADLKVKLYPMNQQAICGHPLLTTMITLGQIPVYLPDSYIYQFDEIENGEVSKRVFNLRVSKRIWFWDLFIFNKKFEDKAGLALSGEYYN